MFMSKEKLKVGGSFSRIYSPVYTPAGWSLTLGSRLFILPVVAMLVVCKDKIRGYLLSNYRSADL